MKVYIVHPHFDYGILSIHATRKGAEIALMTKAKEESDEMLNWEKDNNPEDVDEDYIKRWSPEAIAKNYYIQEVYVED